MPEQRRRDLALGRNVYSAIRSFRYGERRLVFYDLSIQLFDGRRRISERL